MSDIKMSELFDLPVDCEMNINPIDDSWSVSINDDITEDQAEAIDHAINNHDRLVQENYKLKDNLNSLIEFISDIQLGAEYSYELELLISKIQGGK